MAPLQASDVHDIIDKSQQSTASHPKFAKRLWALHKGDPEQFDCDIKTFLAVFLQAEVRTVLTTA